MYKCIKPYLQQQHKKVTKVKLRRDGKNKKICRVGVDFVYWELFGLLDHCGLTYYCCDVMRVTVCPALAPVNTPSKKRRHSKWEKLINNDYADT